MGRSAINDVTTSLSKVLSEELEEEIRWRVYEIAALKKVTKLSKISDENREVISKYTIPAFYALWEGFVSKAFEIYAKTINKLKLNHKDIHPNILTHDLDVKKGLKDGRTSLNKQVELTLDLINYFESDLLISGKVPTKSNVNFRVINSILERFNLSKFNKGKYEFQLNKLLKYRNDIAHGDNSLIVDDNIIAELSKTSIDCMYELQEKIEVGFDNKSYLNNQVKRI